MSSRTVTSDGSDGSDGSYGSYGSYGRSNYNPGLNIVEIEKSPPNYT